MLNSARIELHLHLDGSFNLKWAYEKSLMRGVIPAGTSFVDYYNLLFANNAKPHNVSITKFDLTCNILQRWLHDRLDADIDKVTKRTLFHGLMDDDYAHVASFHTGDLTHRLNNDVRSVKDGLLGVLPGLLTMITRLVLIVYALGVTDLRMTLFLAGFALVVIVTTGYMRRKLKDLHKAVSAADGKLLGFIQESLENILLIQSMNAQLAIQARSDDLLGSRYELQRKRRRITLLANSGVSTISRVLTLSALLWCGSAVLKGTMTIGDLTAITQLVNQLRAPMINVSGILPRLTAMTAALERLMEIDYYKDGPQRYLDLTTCHQYGSITQIEGSHIGFAYAPNRGPTLRDGSFTIPRGSFTVITGPSGGGKSTLLKLLLGIFPPDRGTIGFRTEDGELTDFSWQTRSLFAYVPQGNLLFSGTLRENLLLTRPHATEEEIQNAIFVSGMDRFLPELPDGLDTMLGENAHGLSEGQAQRLAIARAVLGDAPILLLDECTSALDAETELVVLQRLSQLPDRTCIAVTHREAARVLADSEIRVFDGHIVQKG